MFPFSDFSMYYNGTVIRDGDDWRVCRTDEEGSGSEYVRLYPLDNYQNRGRGLSEARVAGLPAPPTTPSTPESPIYTRKVYTELLNWDRLAWPKLGYRMTKGVLVYYYRIAVGTAVKGLNMKYLGSQVPAQFSDLMSEVGIPLPTISDGDNLRAVTEQKFTDFDEGIKLLSEGEVPAVVVNHQLAMILSVAKGKLADVLFRDSVVGYISDDLKLVITDDDFTPNEILGIYD
jgi:hypothetical protein